MTDLLLYYYAARVPIETFARNIVQRGVVQVASTYRRHVRSRPH